MIIIACFGKDAKNKGEKSERAKKSLYYKLFLD